jgi:hypothetical protein
MGKPDIVPHRNRVYPKSVATSRLVILPFAIRLMASMSWKFAARRWDPLMLPRRAWARMRLQHRSTRASFSIEARAVQARATTKARATVLPSTQPASLRLALLKKMKLVMAPAMRTQMPKMSVKAAQSHRHRLLSLRYLSSPFFCGLGDATPVKGKYSDFGSAEKVDEPGVHGCWWGLGVGLSRYSGPWLMGWYW